MEQEGQIYFSFIAPAKLMYFCGLMLYRIFKIIVGAAFRFYFRKITILGQKNIPKSGPVLMLCNHPSSFMEAMLLACYQHRTLHFLVRGDMFEKKWLKPILTLTNQIPIYRRRDGFEKLRNNRSTFEYCYDILSQNKVVLIFPEANTAMVRFLRPLQKGAARLALGTILERPVDDLMVIPCGVNFKNVLHSGHDALVIFGEAISIRQFYNEHQNGQDQLEKLTNVFTEKMEEVVFSIPENVDTKVYDGLFDILMPIDLKKSKPKELHRKHQAILQAIERHSEDLALWLNAYTNLDRDVKAMEFSYQNSFLNRSAHLIKLILVFILGLPGLFIYGVPLILGTWFGFNQIKSKEFIPPVRLAVSILLILVEVIVLFSIGLYYLPILFLLWMLLASLVSLFLMIYFLQNAFEKKYSYNKRLHQEKRIRLSYRNKIVECVNTYL